MMVIPTVLARAQIAEAEADYAKVRRLAAPLTRMAAGTSLQEPGYWPWPDLSGQRPGARRRTSTMRTPSCGRTSGVPRRVGTGRRRPVSATPAAGWHGALGDIHAARRSFEASLELLQGLPLRYDAARVNFAYGQTLRRAGKRRQADAVISTARELYPVPRRAHLCRTVRPRAQGGRTAPGPWHAGRRESHAAGRGRHEPRRPRVFRIARWPRSSSCRRRRCSITSPASTPSSACAPARSWRHCAADASSVTGAAVLSTTSS